MEYSNLAQLFLNQSGNGVISHALIGSENYPSMEDGTSYSGLPNGDWLWAFTLQLTYNVLPMVMSDMQSRIQIYQLQPGKPILAKSPLSYNV
jgi:hypothetical protein